MLTSLPSLISAFAFSRASRTIEELKGPHRPRSAVQTTRRCTLLAPVPASNFGAESLPATADAIEPSTFPIRSAKGRAASAATCARRSFEAATICMALVIFCVALVAVMRTRMSLRLAMSNCPRSLPMPPSGECLGVAVDQAFELGRIGIRQVTALADAVEQIGVLAAQQRQEPGLEWSHASDVHRVKIAVYACVDHADLLLHLQRGKLRLLEKLGQTRAAIEQSLGRRIEVGAELGEGRHLAVLGQLAFDP